MAEPTGEQLYKDALGYARQRRVTLPAAYYGNRRLEARAFSFSVAGLTQIDQIKGVLDSLNEAVRNGTTFDDWKKTVRSKAVGVGLPDYRLENIFRTNIQNAYMAGRYEQQSRNFRARPFLMYDAINDSRVRPAHLAMDGYIARHDAPVWDRWTPPCGYNCRCSLTALSEAQARKRGYNGKPPPNVAPDPGWDYDRREGWQESIQKAALAKKEALTRGIVPEWVAPLQVRERIQQITDELATLRERVSVDSLQQSLGRATYANLADAALSRPAARTLANAVNLFDHEAVALRAWTTARHSTINAYLRGEADPDAKMAARAWPIVIAGMNALEKLPEFTGTVYRGVNSAKLGDFAGLYLHEFRRGKIIRLAGFAAGSRSVGRYFKHDVRMIVTGGGGRDISEFSVYPNQHEILYPHASTFRVLEVEQAEGITWIWLKHIEP